MLIGITGLHGAGKSYFCNTIPPEFGFKVFSKKEELSRIYKIKTNRDDWKIWYRKEYEKDPKKITEFILSGIQKDENVILDAIHSPVEWHIIKEHFPNAELAEIITPNLIRLQRITNQDLEKDKERIKHWHSEDGCLLSEVGWSFNGAASKELNERSFKEFVDFIKQKERNEHDKEDLIL
mgnify:CR=1 FL=1